MQRYRLGGREEPADSTDGVCGYEDPAGPPLRIEEVAAEPDCGAQRPEPPADGRHAGHQGRAGDKRQNVHHHVIVELVEIGDGAHVRELGGQRGSVPRPRTRSGGVFVALDLVGRVPAQER